MFYKAYKYVVVYTCEKCKKELDNNFGSGRDLGFDCKADIKKRVSIECPVCENQNVLVLDKEATWSIYKLKIL